MQPKGDQDYWPAPSAADQPMPTPPSQYAGYDMEQDAPDHEESAHDGAHVEPISWQASEYVHHEKSMLWFLVFIAVAAVLAAIALLLLRSWTFTALVFVMAIAAIVYARRPPRTLTYTLTHKGIVIDEREYAYREFRAFSLVKEEPFFSIMLIPVKRFLPAVNLYFPPENGEKVVDTLGAFLPLQKHELDFVDKLVRKIRF